MEFTTLDELVHAFSEEFQRWVRVFAWEDERMLGKADDQKEFAEEKATALLVSNHAPYLRHPLPEHWQENITEG